MKRSVYLFLSTAVVLLHLAGCQAAAATECEQAKFYLHTNVLPERSISYQDDHAPVWKTNWDQARKLFRQKKYTQALAQYEQLFLQKNNIYQARWEYISLLMQQKRWRKATTELAILIAQDSLRPDYQLAKAEIALGNREFSNAAASYARLYRQQRHVNGCSEDLARILSGYIAALGELKKFKTLLPLQEELSMLRPPGYIFLKKTSAIAMKNGQPEKKQ